MRNRLILAAAALGSGALGASAAHVNFDSYADNTVLSSQYAGLGVNFSATTTALISDIIAAGPGYNTSSPRNIAFADFPGAVQGTLQILFSSPATAVSFYAIDVGDSSRDAIAYDASNTVLQTISVWNPGSGPGIGNIDLVSFSVSGISYITFGQGSHYAVGDGAGIDDLDFTVPAPGAASLVIGAGLLGARRRR